MNPQAPDINLDGHLENDLLDYELFEPESELKKAFQQTANNLTTGQQFIFFLHGHARTNYFRIMENYELSATYLRDLLAMLPTNIPWLDDDGNGIYNNGDGRRAAKIQLGKEGNHAAPPPTISKVHQPIVLEENITEANLWVHTTPGVDGIRKVRAVLINPQFRSGEYKGLETNFGGEELELIYNAVQQRYGIVYQGFKTPGKWRILYQAQSKEGIWSDIVQGEVQAQSSSKIATIKIAPNLSSYKSTEPVRLDLQIYGQTQADLYVAIIFPEYFITYGYPSDPSYPNEAKIYQTIEVAGQRNYQVNINLPSNAKSGQYSTCGVLIKTNTAPLEMANWIDFHCAGFEVN